MLKITLLMLSSQDDDSHLPGTFIPGAGVGHGWFEIELPASELPGHEGLRKALWNGNNDALLMLYAPETGKGHLVMVDWYAPAVGTRIELEITPPERPVS